MPDHKCLNFSFKFFLYKLKFVKQSPNSAGNIYNCQTKRKQTET